MPVDYSGCVGNSGFGGHLLIGARLHHLGQADQELADVEKAELAVIETFLPAQMDEAETTAAIEAIKAELGASSVKDMGRVMATLKERHGSQLDMSKASALVKAALI